MGAAYCQVVFLRGSRMVCVYVCYRIKRNRIYLKIGIQVELNAFQLRHLKNINKGKSYFF